jgi:hypothetical protein
MPAACVDSSLQLSISAETVLTASHLKGTVSRDFLVQVFFMNHLPSFLPSTTPVANLPPVSTTPAANFATSSPCVVDTGGKFATGINDTSGKFATGVIDTGGKLCEQYQAAGT